MSPTTPGTRVAGLHLAEPVMLAAGCAGTGREAAAYAPLSTYGAVVSRTITLDARAGSRAPRVLESPAGLLHATGLPNPGLTAFCATELPALVQAGARVVVSVAGATPEEITQVVRGLARTSGVSAVELHLCAPDAAEAGVLAPRDGAGVSEAVSAAAGVLPPGVPLLAKLAPVLAGVAEHARAAAGAGAAAVVVGGAQPALLPDGRPAGLSGPAVRPQALRAVHAAATALAGTGVDVVGCGGVTVAADARALLDAGAAVVQVGSALLSDPTSAARLVTDLRAGRAPDDHT
ncbi:hypothetical protein [Nocardioides bruguierae]|uniref:Dihydroorotate dehydrogenase catalytic domain-containing protein n=1 Tax=Nocardioides bruguierae TaxID=2945102 RepID=A0A9X2D449_9ACTN|nr:hypothetical protein [Nocardioides bruguierae]MCM0618695.1 hypothetical protein [Nocardioides bruguierae]